MKRYYFNAPTFFEFELKDLAAIKRYKQAAGTPHRAEFYQIVRIETGKSTQTLDFNPVEVVAGQLLFVAKNQVISFDTSSDYNGQIMLFTDMFFNRCECDVRFLKQLNLFNPFTKNAPLSINQKQKSILNLIKNEFQAEQTALQSDAIHHLLCAFLIEAARQQSESTSQTHSIDYQTALQFAELVEHNFKTLRKVNDYLNLMNISDKNLSKALKTTVSKSPKQFIDERIVLEAKRMLAYGNESVKEITFLLGFDEHTNFTKFFNKTTGMLPSQFRSTMKK